MTANEMLAILCNFLAKKQIVYGDEDSIKDMVIRYKFPPFTVLYPVVMRMTMKDAQELNEILKAAHGFLSSNEVTPLSTPIVEPPEGEEPNEPLP